MAGPRFKERALGEVVQFKRPVDIEIDDNFTLQDVIEFTMDACDFTECIAIGRDKDGDLAIITSDTYQEAIDLMQEMLRRWGASDILTPE